MYNAVYTERKDPCPVLHLVRQCGHDSRELLPALLHIHRLWGDSLLCRMQESLDG